MATTGAAGAADETFREAKAATGALAATAREEEARRATAGAEARARRVVCMVLRVWKRGETESGKARELGDCERGRREKARSSFFVVGDFFPLSFQPYNLVQPFLILFQ